MVDWIIFAVSNAFILFGLFIACSAIIGLYRFDFVVNRMHAAAMNDTLGILLVLVGLMIQSGFQFATLKMLITSAYGSSKSGNSCWFSAMNVSPSPLSTILRRNIPCDLVSIT